MFTLLLNQVFSYLQLPAIGRRPPRLQLPRLPALPLPLRDPQHPRVRSLPLLRVSLYVSTHENSAISSRVPFLLFSLSRSHCREEAKTGKEDSAMWTVQTALSSTGSRRTGAVGSLWQLPQFVSYHLCKLRDGPGRRSIFVFLLSWCLILLNFLSYLIINPISVRLDLFIFFNLHCYH